MTAPAGWYPDGNGQRYWDGSEWTDLRAPGAAQRPWSGLCIAAFVCGVFAVGMWLILPVSVVLSVLSIVFAIIGTRTARRLVARGTGLAAWGAVFGALAVAAWIVGGIGAALQ